MLIFFSTGVWRPIIRWLELDDPCIRSALYFRRGQRCFVHISEIVRDRCTRGTHACFLLTFPYRKADAYTFPYVHCKYFIYTFWQKNLDSKRDVLSTDRRLNVDKITNIFLCSFSVFLLSPDVDDEQCVWSHQLLLANVVAVRGRFGRRNAVAASH